MRHSRGRKIRIKFTMPARDLIESRVACPVGAEYREADKLRDVGVLGAVNHSFLQGDLLLAGTEREKRQIYVFECTGQHRSVVKGALDDLYGRTESRGSLFTIADEGSNRDSV